MSDNRPNLADVQAAQKAFEEKEPRDLFYKAATELVDLAMRGCSKITLAEAICVLLKTWNVSYYRFHKKFDLSHICKIESLLKRSHSMLRSLRDRSIDSLIEDDRDATGSLFAIFEHELGPVGVAKALHLLAPKFFPIWDRKIAKAYGLALRSKKPNLDRYWKFMLKSKQQCATLYCEGFQGNALKAVDEYNYCRFTLKLGDDRFETRQV